MRLFDNLTSRLSIDADFSVEESITNEKTFFNSIKASVGSQFRKFKYDIIDFTWKRKPKKRNADFPDWWGGWSCEFKLVSFRHRGKDIITKRRNALSPEGANSTKILVEISEHEYCGKKRTKMIHGIKVLGYSRELLVLEKIRAICQQHPDYSFRSSKNRARDFYDIYELTSKAGSEFADSCSHHIEKVFAAKEVPMSLLSALWDETFIDEQRRGFDEVKDTVSSRIHDFNVYLEHLRFLVKEIYPAAI